MDNLNLEVNQNLLLAIYTECNGHLKEQSHKLWQVITLSTSILTLYFAQELIRNTPLDFSTIIISVLPQLLFFC